MSLHDPQRSLQLLALKNPVRVDQAPYRYELVDPINHWPDFNRIVRDRDAVVVITAVPNLLDEIDYSKVLQIADPKVDVRSVSLYRDGVLVQALDSGRTPAVAAVSEYVARRNRPARTQGIIAVRLDAFAPANARYEVRVDVGTPTPLTIDVTDAARAVRADLARWRSASR